MGFIVIALLLMTHVGLKTDLQNQPTISTQHHPVGRPLGRQMVLVDKVVGLKADLQVDL